MNHDLVMLSTWSKQWLVTFNPLKTEAILFTTQNVHYPSLYFENILVSFVQNHKHLGVTISNNGKWYAHIENLLLKF